MIPDKYQPKSLKDIIGQDDIKPMIIGWAKSWDINRPAYKSMLFYGTPGTGKTATAHCIAYDHGWDVLEINASDSRKADELKELIGNAIYTSSMKNKVLILIDEADSLGKSGFKILESMIEETVNPIILTCNDEYAIKKITTYFRESSLLIKFKKLPEWKLETYAKNIAKLEGINNPLIDDLVSSAQGDLRYILNNLETPEVIPRTEEQNIFVVVHDIFAGKWDGDTRGADVDQIWFCIKQNIDGFYNDIHGMSVPEFVELIDHRFSEFYKLTKFDQKSAYRQWSHIIAIWKMMPRHQKTKKIELKPSPFKTEIDPDLAAMAKDLHMSYKKASSKLDQTYLLLKIWKEGKKKQLAKPKPILKLVQKDSRTADLFSFVSQSSAAVNAGTPDGT